MEDVPETVETSGDGAQPDVPHLQIEVGDAVEAKAELSSKGKDGTELHAPGDIGVVQRVFAGPDGDDFCEILWARTAKRSSIRMSAWPSKLWRCEGDEEMVKEVVANILVAKAAAKATISGKAAATRKEEGEAGKKNGEKEDVKQARKEQEAEEFLQKQREPFSLVMIAGKDLPAMTEQRTYTCVSASWRALGMFFSFLFLFLACFLGIRGPDGEWPVAWWSMCFLCSGIGLAFLAMRSSPATLIRTSSSLVGYNLFGSVLWDVSVSSMESLERRPGWFGRHLRITVSDKLLEKWKKQAGVFECCVRKCLCLDIDQWDDFLEEHGMQRLEEELEWDAIRKVPL